MLLIDFIETPSQNFTPEDLKTAVTEFMTTLNENSLLVVNTIRDSYCPATYLLHDLAKKMELQNCPQQFALLYDNHLDELVDLCVWSWHDLQRFINNQPDYLEKIMEGISKNDGCFQRLLGDMSHSEEIMDYIKELNPEYEFQDQFSDLYSSESRPRMS